MSKIDMAVSALGVVNPMAALVIQGVRVARDAISKASEQGVEKLSEELTKQELLLQFSQMQARIEQELAIARRIDNAEEVEIEEFYDNSGKGSLDLAGDAVTQSGKLSLGAEGRRVTKRVYHFKGWSPLAQGAMLDSNERNPVCESSVSE